MPYIGEKLRELRLEKKMTQMKLAKALDLSKSAIVQYEHNKREPNLDSLIKIERFFNVSTQYLTGKSQYKRISEDIFYNNAIQNSDSFYRENEFTQRKIISLINAFNYFVECILDEATPQTKDLILNQLYTIVRMIHSITMGKLTEYPEMYEGEFLNKFELYKIQEKNFQVTLSDMENLLKSFFDIRFESLYNTYCESYPEHAGNKEYIQMLKEYIAEIRLQGIEKYGKLQ